MNGKGRGRERENKEPYASQFSFSSPLEGRRRKESLIRKESIYVEWEGKEKTKGKKRDAYAFFFCFYLHRPDRSRADQYRFRKKDSAQQHHNKYLEEKKKTRKVEILRKNIPNVLFVLVFYVPDTSSEISWKFLLELRKSFQIHFLEHVIDVAMRVEIPYYCKNQTKSSILFKMEYICYGGRFGWSASNFDKSDFSSDVPPPPPRAPPLPPNSTI